ncbi:PhlD [Kitasatospora sp. NPDC086009]|uniref:PhlD n=1 Tax=unclassified Kitasatospora TaxID=2633591 RepID=UPI002E2F0209|nr:PhlD [Kitasatospora sp. NBC_01246]
MPTPTTAYVGRPAVVAGPHLVRAERIRDDILARNPRYSPRQAQTVRMALSNLPGTRRYFQPYEVVTSPDRTAAERKTTTMADLLAAAESAAREALANAGAGTADVDCVVVSSATGDGVPGLDILLQQRLGLRPDISRRPMTQLACAGGAHVLIAAQEYLAANPGGVVLVVAGESLSSLYQDSRTSIEDQIYKGLWGDLVGAAVVTGERRTPGLRLGHRFEYTVPGSTDRYRKLTDDRGDHFASTRASLRSVTDLGPALLDWLDRHDARELDFGVLHPGGPAILDRLGTLLGVDEDFLRHSKAVLAEEGNLGGATVFSVLARTHRTPPAAGARGLVFGLGPGVALSALLVTWADGPAV